MEKVELRIEGIYDQRTFKFLREMGVSHFSFDFRTSSFNFLPQYRFLDLLDKGYGTSLSSGIIPFKTYLHFENEKDFVIEKMLAELEKAFPLTKSFQNEGLNPFCLEFSDDLGVNFYEQFRFPFIWHYQEGKLSREILKSEFLHGIVLDQFYLERLIKDGSFPSFIKTFLHLTHIQPGLRSPSLFLTANWDSPMITELFEGLDFHCLSLQINQSIEVCYRNVNLDKLKKNVQIFQKNILEAFV